MGGERGRAGRCAQVQVRSFSQCSVSLRTVDVQGSETKCLECTTASAPDLLMRLCWTAAKLLPAS